VLDCATFSELNFSEWGADLQVKLQGRRYPLSGMFELTERCNLSCVHCYINQSANSQAARARELTTDQAKYVLDQISDAGCLFLILSGGEVLLRQDFPEIYLHAKQRGLLVGIFTNGTMITPQLADMFVEYRPHWIDITLYGATRETYEKVTGVPGSYDRCLRGIELLQERNLPVYLKSAVLTVNYHELPEMRAFSLDHGIQFRYDGVLWPRLDGSPEPLKYQLSPQELLAIEDVEPKRLQEWKRMADTFSGYLDRAEYVYNCGAALQSFNVDCSGRLSACNMSRKPSYSLLEMSFAEGWEKLGELRKMKRKLVTKCQSCRLGGLCSQCPGWSQAVHGDDETPVDFICELAHLHLNQVEQMLEPVTDGAIID
jgi:radical SAM protein with 4Fe4S-binding SPASM domain